MSDIPRTDITLWPTRPQYRPPLRPLAPAQPVFPARTPPVAPGPTEDEWDAKAGLRALLEQWGLGDLTDWLYDQVIVKDKDQDFVLSVLLPQQEAYKRRFAANERRQKKGLRVLSPGEYMAREEASRQARREAGMWPGFFDEPKDFEDMIAEDVSVAEERARIVDGFADVANAPLEVRQGFANLYGVSGDAALAMYYMDPTRALPLLERQEMAARAWGAASRTGFGALNREEAEGIAALGVSEAGFTEGFGQLAASKALFAAEDEGEESITRGEQLGAAFGGNAEAQRVIERRRRRRQAKFEGGGGFVSGQTGFTGLGTSET